MRGTCERTELSILAVNEVRKGFEEAICLMPLFFSNFGMQSRQCFVNQVKDRVPKEICAAIHYEGVPSSLVVLML